MEVAAWLKQNGGFVHENLSVHHTPEKGNHIVGTARPGQLLVSVPGRQLVNIKSLGSNGPSHEKLAKHLYTTHNPWTDSILAVDLPVSWSSDDIDRLPAKYQARVAAQKSLLNSQFASAGVQDYQRWIWAWCAVNSRCLWWDVGLDREDQMTLAPFIDFFNHTTDTENSIKLESKLGKMNAYAPLNPTDEPLLCYGPHENAFLLVEYGFIVDDNKWDHLDITTQIQLLDINRSALRELGYDGEYTLGTDGPCFRTLMALASMDATPKQLYRYSQGLDEPKVPQPVLDKLYQDLKQIYSINPNDRKEIQDLYRGYQRILNPRE